MDRFEVPTATVFRLHLTNLHSSMDRFEGEACLIIQMRSAYLHSSMDRFEGFSGKNS